MAADAVEDLLAGFVAAPPKLPETVRAMARRSLLNMVGTAIGGSGEAAIDRMVALYAELGGTGRSTLVGRRERLNMLWAADVNAAAANIFDFDDTHIPTVIHPSAPVAPALLGLAEARAAEGRPVSGKALLEAFALGMEAACRLGLGAGAGHYARGWHITSTCGAFGAAMAAGRLLGLTVPQLVDALGHALAQNAGSVETLGTMSKSLSVGQAARGGLLAALLAQGGYSGPADPIGGPRGFLHLHSGAPEAEALTAPGWQVLMNTFKPYPCGVVLNPVIEACLALHGTPPGRIESVTLTGHPLLRQRTDRAGVATGRAAQVSAQHAVAVSLLRGRADLAAFSDASAADPELRAFGTKLAFRDDPSFALDAAEVTLHLTGGEEITRRVAAAKGGLSHPLSDEDLAAKFRGQIAWRGLDLDAGALLAALNTIEDAENGAAFLALTTGE